MFLTLNDVNFIRRSDDQTLRTGLDDRIFFRGAMVGRGGLEPPTSRLSGVRSNHLSYRPTCRSGSAGQILPVEGFEACAEGASPRWRNPWSLVEPIGIEPMTS
jgi:hypothetical protein